MSKTLFYNSHHSPIGAFATLTLGMKGAKGGLGIELGGPADRPVYVGVEERDTPGQFRALPFYDLGSDDDAASDFDVENLAGFHRKSALLPFSDESISRKLGPCIDEWKADDLTFRLISRVIPVPDPDNCQPDELKRAVTPALLAELTLDNRQGNHARKAFFGYGADPKDHGMRILDEGGITGLAQGLITGIACRDAEVYAGLAFQPEAILMPIEPANLGFMLGSVGLLVGEVPAGEVRTFRFSVGFFREGIATSGIETRYLYRRFFDRVEDVLKYALDQAEEALTESASFDSRVLENLSFERGFMLSQAIRSYYGSTQLLERKDGRPLWVVNEGEYRMMNTFDLTVDQAFFELAMNPWTLKNELDLFNERYGYQDGVRLPGSEEVLAGGLTFTHDMGVANCFSPPGASCYEQAGLKGCFSYMSAEELINWALCATLYLNQTQDEQWLRANERTFVAVTESMMNRDHPQDSLRKGLIGTDGARCSGGSEITTYDSLDASLGQARNNVYLGGKAWAAYTLLSPILLQLDREDLADACDVQAARCSATILNSVETNGLLPAVIGEDVKAHIIPAIEGLIYPWFVGNSELLSPGGAYRDLISVLSDHFHRVLESGVCRFAEGGWKLSSTSKNSWLSKIYLCQTVAERVFGDGPDDVADRAHFAWLTDPHNAYYAWSDQMLDGEAVGSRYYPRGVTGILWLVESGRLPFESLVSVLRGVPEREAALV